MDDTNVWACPQGSSDRFRGKNGPDEGNRERVEHDDDDDEDDGFSARRNRAKTGKKQVSQLLGIIQRVTLQGANNQSQTVRLHVPSQVLPKASGRLPTFRD